MAQDKLTRALSMIGLCKKAGRIAFGVPLVCEAVREGRAKLVIYASGASENSVKRVCDKCRSYEVEVAPLDVSPDVLGKAIGKTSAVAAVGIIDKGFAEAITKILNS